MGNEKLIIFDPFSLDVANECLWRGSEAIKLRPKTFAVINYLVGRPGQLVTKQELLDTVWPGTFVSDAVLKVAIRQLREALDDDPQSPRFIETAHRRGYRFIGKISPTAAIRTSAPETSNRSMRAAPRTADSSLGVVGREAAMSRMQEWLESVLRGERQIVFVTGEPGIGKTAVVDMFTRSVGADRRIRIASGQCVEHYGTSEAFLPVLDAMRSLSRERPEVVDLLRAHAPMWLLQMPSLLAPADREVLSREMGGASRERMLRAMSEALELLTEEQPLVLVLEDLHWSDYSTLDLISYLARQRQPAQLMLIGTYRPVDLILSGHPLKAVKQELLARHQCRELPLDYLSQQAVVEYLSNRFPAHRFPSQLAELIHERTEGNALFMVNMIDYLVGEGLIVEHKKSWKLGVELDKVEVGVPDSIKQMIEKQVEHLDADEQRTLEAASVAGAEFSTLVVAAGLAEDLALVETRCDKLARRQQFIQDSGVQILPNGDAAPRYSFIHALYQNLLYERAPASRRMRLHRLMGERGEQIYGDRAAEIAAELAMHFERGRDYERAAKYLRLAANNAIRRFAYHEAVGLARRGIDLIERLPQTPDNVYQDLCLHLALGVPLIATEGYAAPDVGDVYRKARQLYEKVGDTPEISEILWGLWTFHTLRAELEIAREIAEEFLNLAARLPYPGLALRGHWALEITSMHLGEFRLTLDHFEKALAVYDPEKHRDDSFFYALNPGVAMPCFAAWSLLFLGQPDQALLRIEDALTLAQELSEPHDLAHAYNFAALLHQFRQDAAKAQEFAEAALEVSSEHGLVLYQAMATITRGWAMAVQDGQGQWIEEMRQGLAALQATGTELVRPHYSALLAEALWREGKPREGLEILDEAIAVINRTGERFYEAELYRLKGELLLMQAAGAQVSQSATSIETMLDTQPTVVAKAEECFDLAIQIAKQQEAKSLELRAAMSLARLHQTQARQTLARDLLSRVYDRFTEGFETADLREAKRLLETLC